MVISNVKVTELDTIINYNCIKQNSKKIETIIILDDSNNTDIVLYSYAISSIMSHSIQHALIKYPDDSVVPASPLDNILVPSGTPMTYSFHSCLTGAKLDSSNRQDFYDQIKANINAKVYPTMDNLLITTNIGQYNICYATLDNSVKSNICGHPLKSRLIAICQVITATIKDIGGDCVIFLSESCRSSFDGGDTNDRKDEMTWFKMRQIIASNCNLKYLGECANNDINGMAFGISAFCTKDYVEHINAVLPRKIQTDGNGTAALGVQFNNGQTVWSLHFPLDFKTPGPANLGAKAIVNLCNLMRSHPGSVCTIGDFNTIPGIIAQSIYDALPSDFEFVIKNELSFFGAHYDTVKADGEWELI